MQKFGVVAWQKDLNASDAPIFVGSTLLATIRAPRSAKETAMQIDCGTLRRALKNLVRLEPMQPKRPMLEHVLFEPTWNDVALTGRLEGPPTRTSRVLHLPSIGGSMLC